ncbi:MAG: response regulator [Phenylobacterium sp.]
MGNASSTNLPASLKGLRVLVVEDEMIVSMLIEDMLADLGCTVVGPAFTLASGLEIARSAEFDCALLDVNLGGERVFPLVDLLREKGARIVFSTGYGRAGLRDEDQSRPVLQKPFRESELERTLTAAVAAPA